MLDLLFAYSEPSPIRVIQHMDCWQLDLLPGNCELNHYSGKRWQPRTANFSEDNAMRCQDGRLKENSHSIIELTLRIEYACKGNTGHLPKNGRGSILSAKFNYPLSPYVSKNLKPVTHVIVFWQGREQKQQLVLMWKQLRLHSLSAHLGNTKVSVPILWQQNLS